MLHRINRILPFLIVTLLCIGGVELFYGLAEHYLLKQEPLQPEAQVSAGLPGKPEAKPKQHRNYDIIMERNLFSSYLEEETEVVAENTNPLEGLETTTLDLVLMGTITGPKGRSRAIIMEKAKRKQELYYKGDYVQDAEIKDILRGKVILSYQGKDEVLDMSEAASMRPKQPEQAAVSPTPNRRRIISRPAPQAKRRVVPPSEEGVADALDETLTEIEEQVAEDEFDAELGEELPVDDGEQVEGGQPEPLPVDGGGDPGLQSVDSDFVQE